MGKRVLGSMICLSIWASAVWAAGNQENVGPHAFAGDYVFVPSAQPYERTQEGTKFFVDIVHSKTGRVIMRRYIYTAAPTSAIRVSETDAEVDHTLPGKEASIVWLECGGGTLSALDMFNVWHRVDAFDEPTAIALAWDKAEQQGCYTSGYAISVVAPPQPDAPVWKIYFHMKPPAPSGSHFMITIDDTSGVIQLFAGQ